MMSLLILTFLAGVTVFVQVSGWQLSPTCSIISRRHRSVGSRLWLLKTEVQEVLVTAPEDKNYSPNPLVRLRALLNSVALTKEGGLEHDAYMKESGGVWRSKFAFTDTYAISSVAPGLTDQLAAAEAKRQLKNSWPDQVIDIVGPSSLIAAEFVTDPKFKIQRKIYADTLSLRAIRRNSLADMEAVVASTMKEWGNVADEGGTLVFAKSISSITFRIIVKSVFGNEVTDSELRKIQKCFDIIPKGIFGFRSESWLVRQIPVLNNYAKAMDSRREMKGVVEGIIDRRRQKRMRLQTDEDEMTMLDALLQSNFPPDEIADFAVDNVILSIFAGFDTTASVTTNLVLMLAQDMEARSAIRRELESFDLANLPPTTTEVLDYLPYLKSAVHETFRLRPVVGGSFRQTTEEIQIGKVLIPKGKTVAWNNIKGFRSDALYDKPEKACPMRFLRSSSSSNEGDGADDSATNAKLEPLPPMFGYGQHSCPGQFLAQLEIALIMKAFLQRFHFDVEEGQDLSLTQPWLVPKSGLRLLLQRRQRK